MPAASPTPNGAGLTSPAPTPAAPPKAKGWCKPAGKRLADLFVAACEFGIEKLARRKPNEPDDDDVDDFGEAMGQQLAIWFPDTEMTPGKQLMLSGAFIAGAMCIGAEKLPPEPKKLHGLDAQKNGAAGPSAAPAASSTSAETPPLS